MTEHDEFKLAEVKASIKERWPDHDPDCSGRDPFVSHFGEPFGIYPEKTEDDMCDCGKHKSERLFYKLVKLRRKHKQETKT